jgi:adenylyl-sulfate kinase
MPTGFTLWFTGLSGSGKSTLANAVAEEIKRSGRLVDLLDGDVVRQHLSKGLGFSKEDRDINIRRIGFVAHLITKHGGVAITAAISPYRAIRDENRALIGNFVEIFVDCPVEECERRDIKGLYKKARAAVAEGKPMGFTGVDDAYEAPLKPEITVHTAKQSETECVKIILTRLKELGYLGSATGAVTPASRSQPDEAGLASPFPQWERGNLEYIPEELVAKAEAVFRKAGRVHAQELLNELHVGEATAAALINKLVERGKMTLK